MAEQDEQRQDTPVPGRSQTGRAVALARLLHHECTLLLRLYVSYQCTHSLCLPHTRLALRYTPLPVICVLQQLATCRILIRYLTLTICTFTFKTSLWLCVFEWDARVKCAIMLKDLCPTPTPTYPPFSLECLMDRVYWILDFIFLFLFFCFCASFLLEHILIDQCDQYGCHLVLYLELL